MAFSASEISSWIRGRVVNADAFAASPDQIRIEKPAPLASSREADVAFFFSRTYERELPRASPGVLIIGEPFVEPLRASGLPLWKSSLVIACEDPYLAMAILSEKFAAQLSSVAQNRPPKNEIHPSAIVDSTSELGTGVRIGAHCVVSEGVQIGDGSQLQSGVFVGPRAVIGQDCMIFSNVSIYEWVRLGNRVRIHSGSVLGSDGFGYAPERRDQQVVGHRKIFHLGRVVIGDDVEIGANSCVDRGTIDDTRVDRMAKLDNLVHIGHNSHVEEGAVICGGTCLAGNAHVGRFAYIGGLTGITNHVHVGDGAQVGAVSLITKDVPAGGNAVGNPQRTHREHFRAHGILNKLLRGRNER